VDGPSERTYLQILPPGALVEIAVGVLMERWQMDVAEARSYLLAWAYGDGRAVDELAGEVVRHRGV
jgi:hypothetical protein